MRLTLLAQAFMPLTFWWNTFSTAVFIINRLPTSILGNISLYQAAFGQLLDYKFLKVFGSARFPCLQPYQSHKFQFHSQKCVFIGYSDEYKGYKCLNSTGRIFISHHVVFHENELIFTKGFLLTHHLHERHNHLLSIFLLFFISPSILVLHHLHHLHYSCNRAAFQ